MLNSCSGERTVAGPSVFELSSLTMLNSCSGERTVAGPSVFELSTFTMSTKYPYSALAWNYIVQTSLAWRPPPFCHDVRTLDYPIGRPRHGFLSSRPHTALLLVTHSSAPACYWRLVLARASPSLSHTVQNRCIPSRLKATVLYCRIPSRLRRT